MKIREKQFAALFAEAKFYSGAFVKTPQYQKARKLDCNKKYLRFPGIFGNVS